MIWFTSDTHWGYSNIIKYCNRPFSSIDEMDQTIISNINSLVKPNDTLYHLGDFAFRYAKDLSFYRNQINCKTIHLILGNHDSLKINDRKLFSTISGYKEVRWAKQTIILCHYALRIWNKCHYGTTHLFGHSHGTLPPYERSFDVGVDCHDFKPLSVEQVLEITRKIPYTRVDDR